MGGEAMTRKWGVTIVVFLFLASCASISAQETRLPEGVKAVWDMAKAYRETTPTREHISINGLWRWQPAQDDSQKVPAGNWGYFKVPGPWPKAQDGSQRLYPHPNWKNTNLSQVTTTWYQREITIPENWAGRRIAVYARHVNSHATVYLDGVEMGKILYPDGEVDISRGCKAGRTHVLSMRVMALPLKSVIMTYSQTDEAKLVKGSVSRRGLTGDVYLVSTPTQERILL